MAKREQLSRVNRTTQGSLNKQQRPAQPQGRSQKPRQNPKTAQQRLQAKPPVNSDKLANRELVYDENVEFEFNPNKNVELLDSESTVSNNKKQKKGKKKHKASISASATPASNNKKKKHKWVKPVGITALVVALVGGSFWGYYNYVAYPPIAKRDEINSPLGAIRRLQDYIKNKKWDDLNKELGTISYLGQELSYANGDEQVETLINNIMSKVTIKPKKVKALNIYGDTRIDPKTKEEVYIDSLVTEKDETVTINHVDYTKIIFDTNEIQAFLKSKNIAVGQPDYANQVIPVFCEYLNNLNWDDIPMVDTEHKPLIKDNKITPEEEASIDDLLFASKEFNDMLTRFDIAVNNGKEPVTEQWANWSKMKPEDQKKNKEPNKYMDGYVMSRKWCGANFLQNHFVNELGEQQKIVAQSGDGTIERPASLGTSVLTYVITKDKDQKKDIANPIRVEMTEVLTGDECLNYLATKDNRNRGLNESSQTKYAFIKFKVTNMSNDKLTIKDNSSLADKAGNLSARTGTMYGLTSQVTLNKGQSAEIETWVASTELDRKYLIWGADFAKKSPNIYFKVFRGEQADSTEESVETTPLFDEKQGD